VWYHNAALRRAAGEAAMAVVEEGRGASERTTGLVRELVLEK
jgi:hypothetical protein